MAVPTEAEAERHLRVHGLGIRSARRGDDHVIALDGELELANVVAVEDELSQVEAGDCRAIVLDLRELSFLDSTGIHALMCAHARSMDDGRDIALVVDDGPVQRVLDVCGALDILPRRATA